MTVGHGSALFSEMGICFHLFLPRHYSLGKPWKIQTLEGYQQYPTASFGEPIVEKLEGMVLSWAGKDCSVQLPTEYRVERSTGA